MISIIRLWLSLWLCGECYYTQSESLFHGK